MRSPGPRSQLPPHERFFLILLLYFLLFHIMNCIAVITLGKERNITKRKSQTVTCKSNSKPASWLQKFSQESMQFHTMAQPCL